MSINITISVKNPEDLLSEVERVKKHIQTWASAEPTEVRNAPPTTTTNGKRRRRTKAEIAADKLKGEATTPKANPATETDDLDDILDSEPAKAEATEEDAKAAVKRVFDAHGLELVKGVLSRFGVKRLAELDAKHYAQFIENAAKAVKSGKA